MKHLTIYQITNIITGQIYIGQHVSNKHFLDTNYYGSCSQLKLDIKTLGRDKFKREVRYYCRNDDELNVVEAAIVDKDFISRTDTYNNRVGGGYDRSSVVEANKNRSAEWKIAVSNAAKNQTAEHITNNRAAVSEANKNRSPEWKAGQSVAMINANKVQVTCPHCSKTGGRPIMTRWHFDKCKLISN